MSLASALDGEKSRPRGLLDHFSVIEDPRELWRVFATLQDRLVKELVDAGITTIAEANRFIKEVYLPTHNRRFTVEAAEP